MRDTTRRTLLVAACAVMAASALVPGSMSAGRGMVGAGIAQVAQTVNVDAASPAVAPPRPVQSSTPVAQPRAADLPDAPSEEDAPVVVDEVEESDPATFVAQMDILSADDFAPPAFGPGDGPCPKASTCDRNHIRPAKWKTDETGKLEIAWRFNDEGRRNLRAPTGLLEGSVKRSMAEWSRWNSNIVFTYAGTTTATFGARGADGSCADGTNTVTWHRFDPSVIAAVVTCMDPKTNTVRDADLALNVTQHWENISGEPQSRHTFDIDSIVTHELGHWLSLLDLYDASSLHQTMMGNAEYGETRKRTLALGDIIGLQTAYPCDAEDVCPRTGIVDD